MIGNILNCSIDYFSKSHNNKYESSLNKISNEIEKILDESILVKVCEIVINSKYEEYDFKDIKEYIENILEMCKEYFRSVTEVDIQLNNIENVSENKLQYLSTRFLSYDNTIDKCSFIQPSYKYSYSDKDYVLSKFKDFKISNFNQIDDISSDEIISGGYKNILKFITKVLNYLNYINYNNYLLINNIKLEEYISYIFNYIKNNIKLNYYIMLVKECYIVNKYENSYIHINNLHKKYSDIVDNIFISGSNDISDIIKYYIKNSISKLNELILKVQDIEEDFIIESDRVDYIELSRFLDNTNISLSMDMLNDFSIDEDKLFMSGNSYSKNNVLEFLNNTISSLYNLSDDLEEYISNINYNIIQFETILNGEVFEEDKIFLFIFNKFITLDELSKLKVNKVKKDIENNKEESSIQKFININSDNIIIDDLLEFNYDLSNKYFMTYDRKLPKEISEFLINKYRFINDKEVPTFNIINDLTSKYDSLLPKNLIPIDKLNSNLVCYNNNNSEIILFNLNDKNQRTIANGIYGYMNLIYESIL